MNIIGLLVGAACFSILLAIISVRQIDIQEDVKKIISLLEDKHSEQETDLIEEIEQLKEEKQELIEFVMYAQHDAGCNYPFSEKYGCKCGLKYLQDKYKQETEK